MNVLSLFDGMSCGQLALQKPGIKYDNYFASEIDKYAQIVSKANFPNTIYLGDVRNIDTSKLPQIDLLIGGSPCQSFSFAGKRKGMITKDNIEILTLEHYLSLKAEGFEFEGQSYLFWEYVRILNEIKPKYFLLENVIMIEKWKSTISKALNIKPIRINSRLLSAQNRDRYYWTNIYSSQSGLFNELICHIPTPKDKGILLKDIIESEVDEKYYLSENSFIFNRIKEKHEFTPRIPSLNKKSNTCKVGGAGVDDLIIHSLMPRTSVNGNGGSGHLQKQDNKSYYLDTANNQAIGVVSLNQNIRRLTPIECERLQTVPDNYTNYVSDTQRYKMLGNGWTIDVIAYIFNYLKTN